MIQKAVMILMVFIFSTHAPIGRYKNVEIFDIDKEAVIKTVQSNSAIQKEAESYLKGITGIYTKFNPIPKSGFMVKVPLQPSVKLKNQWFDASVDEVIMLYPADGNPYLMVFDSEGRPVFFNFKADTHGLLKELNFESAA